MHSSPSVSRHGVLCYLLLQPSLPLPGKALGQEDRQTDTPPKTTAPAAPQNAPKPWPRPSCSSRFLQSPLHAPLQPKTLGRHQLLCPWGSSPARPRAKHSTVCFSAGVWGEKGSARPETALFQHGWVMFPCRMWDMSQLQRTSVWLDTQRLLCKEERGRAGGTCRARDLLLGKKMAGKIGTGRQGEPGGSS